MKKIALNSLDKMIIWDTALCLRINRYVLKKPVHLIFKTVSRLGDGGFWYTMMALALLVEGWSALLPILQTLIAGATGLLLYKILKNKTVRPRPYQVHQVVSLGEHPLDTFSFPSGHTLHAVLFTVMLGVYFPWTLWVCVPFMCLVALSRMILGLHYPSDVVVGGGIGASIAYGMMTVFTVT